MSWTVLDLWVSADLDYTPKGLTVFLCHKTRTLLLVEMNDTTLFCSDALHHPGHMSLFWCCDEPVSLL